ACAWWAASAVLNRPLMVLIVSAARSWRAGVRVASVRTRDRPLAGRGTLALLESAARRRQERADRNPIDILGAEDNVHSHSISVLLRLGRSSATPREATPLRTAGQIAARVSRPK